MKKYLSMLLAAAVLLLSACAPSAEPEESALPSQEVVPEEEWSLRREKMTQAEAEQAPEQTVTIDTALGAVRGVQLEGYREFRGVRYATAERWQAAEAVTGWEGVYDATQWGDRCPQYVGFYGKMNTLVNQFYADEALVTFPAGYSEDCLNLNIWTPDGAENCPVLVFIHGGAFLTGSNTDTSIDGEAYARQGVITVAINYRLGPYGNVYGEGYDSNLALTDQLTALRWLRDNIADYGGDPSRITIMGESAGAISVQNLLMSPLVEDGLIAGAIMLSGGGNMSGIGSPTTTAVMGMVWDQVVKGGGVDSLEALESLSARELYDLWDANLGMLEALACNPVVDGVALTDGVTAALDGGMMKDVPTIIGMLSDDMLPYVLYNSAVEYSQKQAAAGDEPVYLYYFDRVQPGDTTFGAFHAADLYYVFGTLYRNQRPFDDTDYRIAEEMIAYIANFVKTGDPNGDGLAQWEPAAGEEPLFLHFGDAAAAMLSPDPEQLLATQQKGVMFPYAQTFKAAG